MRLLDLTLSTPEDNLALDEALLNEAEESSEPRETLRLWESPETFVVLGRNSQVAQEVNLESCEARGIKILRRASGGASIVTARGCLMYGVVLSYETRPALRSLDEAHRFVLETMLSALRPLVSDVERQGTSDLAIGNEKFSGNSVRCKRRTMLYHGTLLYDFDLPLVETCLTMPPRQPEYRRNRTHRAFLTNLPASAQALRDAVASAWQARPDDTSWPNQRVRDLVASRYGQRDWNYKH